MKIRYKMKVFSLAFIYLIFFVAPLFSQPKQDITVDTAPSGFSTLVYEWTPLKGNKGKVLAKGTTPLKITDKVLTDVRGIVVVVDGKEKGYINEERTFFLPYNETFALQLESQKDYDSKKAKSRESIKPERKLRSTSRKIIPPGSEAVKSDKSSYAIPGTEYEHELEQRKTSMLRRRAD